MGHRSNGALHYRHRDRWGTVDIGSQPPKTQVLRVATKDREPATRRPSQSRLHGTLGGRRDSNPLYHGAKYPKSSPPANFCPSHSGGYLGRVNAAENHQDLSRRSRKMARRQASPSWLAPPSVDRAIASRAVPSGRPRASDGHANSRGANPGIRVSHPPTMGGEFKPNGSGEEALKRPLRSGRSGGVRERSRTIGSPQAEPLP